MTVFRRLQSAPDPTLREEWNRLVRAVEQLLKISASPPLELGMISGSPHLRLGALPVRASERAKLTERLTVGGTAQAKLLSKSGSAWIEGDEITVTDWGLSYPIPAGRRVIVDYHQQSGEWHVLTSQRVPFSPVTDVCCDSGDVVGHATQIFIDGTINESFNPCDPSGGGGGGSDPTSPDQSGGGGDPPEELYFDPSEGGAFV
ncbi:MAG: hypothetical protein N2C14_17245 [Planctomycetales bacterium]